MAEAEAGHASEFVLQVQIEKTWFTPVAILSFDVVLAAADPGVDFAGGIVVERSCGVTSARTTTVRRKVVKVRLTPVAFVASDSLLARASAQLIALQMRGSDLVAVARRALVRLGITVELLFTTLAVRPCRVSLTVETMTSTSGSGE